MHCPSLPRLGTHARRRLLSQLYSGEFAFSACVVSFAVGTTFAHEPTPKKIPTIPLTVVEAEIQLNVPALPSTQVEAIVPTDNFNPTSPFEGTIFDSPFFSPPTRGYGATTATGGMLANTPLLSVPQQLKVVTSEALRDQDIFSVTEAFRNVSGVGADHTTGTLAASSVEFNYLARGLPSTYRRWNGYRSVLI